MDELIKTITVQVLNMLNKKVLLFISGGAVNLKDIFNTLKDFKYIKYSAVLTEAAKTVIPQKYFEDMSIEFLDSKQCIVKAIKESDLIVVPIMTRNTLVKSALGLRDNYLTNGIAEALMRRKKIIAVKDSFHPENPVNVSLGITANEPYNRMLINYAKTLKDFGMEFVNAAELKKVMEKELCLETAPVLEDKTSIIQTKSKSEICLSGIITLTEILSIDKGCEICIKDGSKITPLAMDYVSNNNIKIRNC